MNDLKPIEAGCLAMIVAGHDKKLIGMVVCVGEYAGAHPKVLNGDLWNIDSLITVYNDFGDHIKLSLYPGSMMMRIDDPCLKEDAITVEVEFLGPDLNKNQIKEIISGIND